VENALEVKNIKKIFKNNRGVKDISFDVKKGEIYGLLGANGAGKTTTMKIVAGLIKRYEGECKIMGINIKDDIETALYNIGCLIEKPAFYGYMSPIKNLRLMAKYYTKTEITDKDIEEALRLVNIWDVRNDKISRFSLGMKQRMGLAMAMINNPSLYILDEPSNGLDIEGIVEIREIITNIKQEKGASFLISSHQSAEIEKLCDTVGIIHNGYVSSSDSKVDVLAKFPSFEEYYLHSIGKKGAEA